MRNVELLVVVGGDPPGGHLDDGRIWQGHAETEELFDGWVSLLDRLARS